MFLLRLVNRIIVLERIIITSLLILWMRYHGYNYMDDNWNDERFNWNIKFIYDYMSCGGVKGASKIMSIVHAWMTINRIPNMAWYAGVPKWFCTNLHSTQSSLFQANQTLLMEGSIASLSGSQSLVTRHRLLRIITFSLHILINN